MGTPTTVMGEVRPESDCPDDASLVGLVYRRSFPLPASELWTALTEPRELSRWYGTYTGDPSTGRVRLTMVDEHDSATADVRIVECTPPSRCSVDVDGWLLAVALHTVGRVTTLDFTHSHVPRSEAGEIGPVWQYYLDRLDAALTGGRPPRWSDYLSLVDEYR